MWRPFLKDVSVIAALIGQLGAVAMMLEKGAEGFEGTVIFFLAAISCLLWGQILTNKKEG